jgi:hypothetical protein
MGKLRKNALGGIMKYVSLLAVGVVAIAMSLSGCSNVASDVQSKLSYSNFPAVSGTTWAGTGISSEIYKQVTTIASTGSSNVATAVPLKDQTASIVFNSDGTFSLTDTYIYDANYDTNFIDDNLQYSLSNTAYSFVSLPTISGSSYTTYVESTGNSDSDDWIGHNTFYASNSNLMASYLSNNLLTPTFGTATTYNGTTVYPLILPSTCTFSGYAGKTYETIVMSGTYTTSTSSNSLDTTAYPVLTLTKIVETDTTYSGNSSPTSTTVTSTSTSTSIPSYMAQITPTVTKTTNASGKTTYEMSISVTAGVMESSKATRMLKSMPAKSESSKGISETYSLLDSVPYLSYTP